MPTMTIEESVDQMIAELSKPSGRARRLANPDYRRKMKAVAERLVKPAFAGDPYKRLELNEALSTSDFPVMFGDILDRSLAARYAARPTIWQSIARRTSVRDFRVSKLIDILGGSGILPDIPELEPYPARSMDEAQVQLKTGKTGARIAYSWEAGINDDLSVFQTAPDRLAQAARNTEDMKVTNVFASATGPQSWLGTPATGAGTALSQDSLQVGLSTIDNKTDVDGTPLMIGTPVLMVPPALQLTAQNILRATEVRTTNGSKTSIISGNGLTATPQVVINPWLTYWDKSATAASTWYLFAGPDSVRPAAFAVFLNGHEAIDLRLKGDQGVHVGGGAVDLTEGDFERDGVEYRVRHVVAGSNGFNDAVYVAKGA